MSGNFIKPPSAAEERGPVELPRIYEAAGLPSNYLTAEFVRAHIIPCVANTFSDGEIITVRGDTEEDPVVREHFGAQKYEEGTFGQRLRELFEGDDLTMRQQVDGLIRYSATVFAHDVARGNIQLPPPTLSLHTRPGIISFDGLSLPLARPPQVVVDYGPGLQGRFHIERQLADWQQEGQPYAYLALGKGPFVNGFLMQYWAARLGGDPQLFRSVIGRLYIGREDGIAAATTEFAAVQQQHTGTSEFADVVVASGIHTAGYEEVGAGITNAHKLLRPDGTLLIRAPKSVNQERSGSVPAEAMVDMALSAGFDRNRAQFFDTVTGGEGLAPITQSLAAVFRK